MTNEIITEFVPRERRSPCDHHYEMVIAMESIASNLKWHTRIGYAVFTVGCTTVIAALSAILYFGMLSKQVEINTHQITKITNMIERFHMKEY